MSCKNTYYEKKKKKKVQRKDYAQNEYYSKNCKAKSKNMKITKRSFKKKCEILTEIFQKEKKHKKRTLKK